MRRLAIIASLLAVLGLGFVLSGASDEGGGDADYWVELDNAFGLIEGGDLKVAGVRAGVITEMRLDEASHRALIGIRIDEEGFGSLRADTRCESRPQSLIGEYFVDCLPGTDRRKLEKGTRIPVTRTSSTVAPDLVNAILRRPYRERLSIILGELGAGVGGNGESLNETLRRFAPALRETDRVLAILARQNQTIAELTQAADRVVGDLAENRKDVGRFVLEARDTSRASAERADDIAAGFRELPGFLNRLTPTMRALGRASDSQAGALSNLRASAKGLERLFDNIGPFADASRPAFRALGEASQIGRSAVKAAKPVVDQLGRFSAGTPELAKNLAITLEHLDDRDFAVEPDDKRWNNGKGLTGLEALLNYVYTQTLSTNVYDSSQHYLKVAVFESECAAYREAKTVREDPELEKHCGARVGPKAPGINYPDATAGGEDEQARRQDRRAPDRQQPTGGAPEVPAFRDPPTAGAQPAPVTPPLELKIPKLVPGQPDIPPIKLPELPRLGPIGGDGDAGDDGLLRRSPRTKPLNELQQESLLDFLLGSD